MNALHTIIDQLQSLTQQHVPPELLSHVVLMSIGIFLAGVAVSVFGAKLAKVGITGVFVLIGTLLGVYFARITGWPIAPCLLIAAAMVGAFGALTQRVWVGAMFAMVLTFIVMSAFSFQKIMPHVATFDPVAQWNTTELASMPALPMPEAEVLQERTPDEWFSGLWQFVQEQDATVPVQGKAFILATGVIGLFVGVLAVRFALVFSTSLIGTLLVSAGLMGGIAQLWPAVYQRLFENPGIVSAGVSALMVSSLIVQTMLTRDKSSKSSEAADSA